MAFAFIHRPTILEVAFCRFTESFAKKKLQHGWRECVFLFLFLFLTLMLTHERQNIRLPFFFIHYGIYVY